MADEDITRPSGANVVAIKVAAQGDPLARKMHREAAEELIEDAIRLLSLLEAYGYVDDSVVVDPKAMSVAASTIVTVLRKAQRYLRKAAL